MPLYRPSELRSFLCAIGKEPCRFLSQNFLVDGNIVGKILSAASLSPSSLVIEIGPGPGVLTEAMLAVGARVVAIETDSVFARQLRRLCSCERTLQIVEADVLDCSFEDLCKEPCVLVSNLPYHLTTPILEKIVRSSSLITRAVLMVQKEVAQRLLCQDGQRASLLGVLCSLYYRHLSHFSVPRGCFWPRPHVDSMVMSLERQDWVDGEKANFEKIFFLLRHVFTSKRKLMCGTLSDVFSQDDVMRALASAGLGEKTRVEDVRPSQWTIVLLSLLESTPIGKFLESPSQGASVDGAFTASNKTMSGEKSARVVETK